MLLDPNAHNHLRFKRLDFGQVIVERGWVPLTMLDVVELSAHFPIFLNPLDPDGDPVVHVSPSDSAAPLGGYIPNHWQGYPFTLTGVSGDVDDSGQFHLIKNNLALEADLDSPHFHSGGGYRVFDAQGDCTPIVEDMIQQIQHAIHQWVTQGCRRYTRLLVEADVIIEAQVTLDNGWGYRMPIVDAQRLELRKDWLETQADGLTALLLAEKLIDSQRHLASMIPVRTYPYEMTCTRGPVLSKGRNNGLCLPVLQPSEVEHNRPIAFRHTGRVWSASFVKPEGVRRYHDIHSSVL
jgi:hypothetical protein